MDDRTLKGVVAMSAIWGACVSTILGVVKLWETFWKDRIRLTTSYSFTQEEGAADTITVVNLSGAPVQVSGWTLAWKPNFFSQWNTSTIEVTHEEEGTMFTIPARDRYTLEFQESDKFDWGYRTAEAKGLEGWSRAMTPPSPAQPTAKLALDVSSLDLRMLVWSTPKLAIAIIGGQPARPSSLILPRKGEETRRSHRSVNSNASCVEGWELKPHGRQRSRGAPHERSRS
jgi:hypothetical protein